MRRTMILLLVVPTTTFGPHAYADSAMLHSRLRGQKPAMAAADLLGVINAFYKSSPYQAAFLTCGFKAMCSDAIAQKTESARKQPRFSFRRNIAFIIYGGLYNGFFENFLFNNCFPVVFGEGTDLVTVASKVVVDQLILTPFLCLPAAYIVRALVFRSSVRDALSRYLSDAKKDLLWKYWLIWTPTQCLTFSVVPVHLRIAFIASVSFFWFILLSTISNRAPVKE